MKKLLPFVFAMLAIPAFSQVGFNGLNYQAVVRDANGDPLPNQTVSVYIELYNGVGGGFVSYAEEHSVSTNDQGLITLVIGEGVPVSTMNYADVDWTMDTPWSMEIMMDVAGGTNYTVMGSTQLRAVPYAEHAHTADFLTSGLHWEVAGTVLSNTHGGPVRITGDGQVDGNVNVNGYLSLGGALLWPDWDIDAQPDKLVVNEGGVGPRLTVKEGGNIGIGTEFPDTTLHIVGKLMYQDGTEGEKRVLTSDADGGASWNSLTVETLLGPGTAPAPDPSCLSIVGTAPAGFLPWGMALSGGYAYVVNADPNELQVFDISDPLTPQQVGSRFLGQFPVAVAVQGDHAYVVDQLNDDLRVIDVSDPTSPVLVGSLAIGTLPRSVAVAGDHAFVIDWGTDDLKVIDISNPATPVLVTSLGIGSDPRGMVISGDLAYIVDGGSDDLKVIDISSPSAPTLLGSLGIGPEPSSLAVSGNLAFVVDLSNYDLNVIDVSAPSAPTLVGSLGIGTEARSVTVSGNHLCVAHAAGQGLKVIDISDPASPVLTGTLGIGNLPSAVTGSGNHVYIVDQDSDDLKVVKLFCTMAVTVDPTTGGFTTLNTEGLGGKWQANGADIYNTNSGNVGIGTSTPGSELDIFSPDNLARIIMKNPASTNGANIRLNGLDLSLLNRDAGPLWFATSNLERMRITPSGDVGIGTTAPAYKLDVRGNMRLGNGSDFEQDIHFWSGNGSWQVGTNDAGNGALNNQFYIYDDAVGQYRFTVQRNTGFVGIGTTTPQSALAVNGKITAKEVEVTLAGFPDYVFEADYELMTLKEVEAYILEHGHLPNVPSACEVEEKGLGLGEMNKILLEKVEELTLHAIASDQRIRELERLLMNKPGSSPDHD